MSNLYKANDETFAEGTSKKIVVPDNGVEQIIENVVVIEKNLDIINIIILTKRCLWQV